MELGKNLIGLTYTATGSKTFTTFNPKLNKANDISFTEATSEEIDTAVELAAIAFDAYKNTSSKERAHFLNTIADEILALGDTLVDMYCQETGLPEGRAKGERGRTIFQLQSFANLVSKGSWVDATIDVANPDRTPFPKLDIRRMDIPLGPVVVFGASNFPLAYSTAGGDTASALAAGCPVIVKSHPMHAGTGSLVAEAITLAAKKTGMPDGVFSNLNSSGIEVGQQLVSHPKVKAVGFTGSIRGGRALLDLAAQRPEPIPVFAEMGSINPVVMFSKELEKNTAYWAEAYAKSISLAAGQFCTQPGLILSLKGSVFTNFTNLLVAEIKKIDANCMLHPAIFEGFQFNKNKAQSQPELEVLTDETFAKNSNYALSSIVRVDGGAFLKNRILHEEVFGPYTLLVECESLAQMKSIIMNLDGQLTASLIATEEEAKASFEIIDALQNRVGRLVFNGVPTGVEVCNSMVHGGPYPASTDSRFSAVGVHAIKRWVRPFSFQNFPDSLLPEALKELNPLGIKQTRI
ncbi:MAG: aldehyde dehydrogenase (NADP(+)) [Flavobacteriaceae bacterium]|jgi:alpha-ketoglutaric semialdehyde dehydrogenase|nr:aldehyde dehydrogenase (NADP(+)) [Flavobacteriaceae bacterium]